MSNITNISSIYDIYLIIDPDKEILFAYYFNYFLTH